MIPASEFAGVAFKWDEGQKCGQPYGIVFATGCAALCRGAPGGGVPLKQFKKVFCKDWPLFRLLISKGGNVAGHCVGGERINQ